MASSAPRRKLTLSRMVAVFVMSPQATSIPCTQRSAGRAAGGAAAASRLSAGLLGWHLGLTPIQLMHAVAQSSFGYRCALKLRSSHIDRLTLTCSHGPSAVSHRHRVCWRRPHVLRHLHATVDTADVTPPRCAPQAQARTARHRRRRDGRALRAADISGRRLSSAAHFSQQRR